MPMGHGWSSWPEYDQEHGWSCCGATGGHRQDCPLWEFGEPVGKGGFERRTTSSPEAIERTPLPGAGRPDPWRRYKERAIERDSTKQADHEFRASANNASKGVGERTAEGLGAFVIALAVVFLPGTLLVWAVTGMTKFVSPVVAILLGVPLLSLAAGAVVLVATRDK